MADAELELIFLNDDQIRPYYKEYFGEDRATDVIAFPMSEVGAHGPSTSSGRSRAPLLGCIVISVETAKRQAKEYKHSLWNEIRFLTIHGLLHLLGHDHAKPKEKKIMQAKEQELLALTETI